ncbi:MAG: penicillin acylase family protein [Halioglobus sp.]
MTSSYKPKKAFIGRIRSATSIAAVSLSVLTAVGCGDSRNRAPAPPAQPPMTPPPAITATAYEAELFRTEGGFPHVVAEDWGSLGFGTGYGDAQDNVCITARNTLKIRAQLSANFGPGDGNQNSDYFYAMLAAIGQFDADIDPEMEKLFAGYAAGFNRYLRDTGIDNLPDPSCQGAQWISPMTAEDVKRIHLVPAFLPNFSQLLFPTAPELVASQNLQGKANQKVVVAETQSPPSKDLVATVEAMTSMHDKGSNAVAIGAELSANGRGMLYTNPHLGPDLTFRFSLMHHIIPGVVNMLGANAYDRANVGFGTNGKVAWTNTVSASRSFNWYRLDLVPGDPFRYVFDGETRAIEPVEVTINVKNQDDSVTEQSYTFYRSHFGPMLGLIFTWGEDNAYSLRIADEGARGFQGGAIALQRAQSVRELKAALNQFTSIPGTNIIAADASGETLYIDSSPTPNFSNQQLIDCVIPGRDAFGQEFFGNTQACEWRTDEDSSAPGLVGGANQPFIYRNDYVTNSNDSFWLANPNQPITDALEVYGDIEDERTLRTRSGLMMVAARQAGTDGLPGNTFDIDSLLDRMLSNQHIAGQLLRDDLVTLCKAQPNVTVDEVVVDISTACTALENWDLTSNLDSRGSHVFREFLRILHAGDNARFLPEEGLNYAIPFSVDDPINTPRGLTNDNPGALDALARAVQLLNDAGIAMDAALGDLQSVTRNGERIPLHGGEEWEGVFNKMSLNFAGADGYPEITGSSASWIMAVSFNEEGLQAKGNLTYSQSTNTESVHYADQTKLFSEKAFIDIPYSLEEVRAAATQTTQLAEGTDQCADEGWNAFMMPTFADETACREHFAAIFDARLTDYATP